MAPWSKLTIPAALGSSTYCLPISLPLADNTITLSLDGQYIKLLTDSCSSATLVVYGPEYERLHGVGSCKTFGSCYFCSTENPCNDLLQRKNSTGEFGDGDVYIYVEHTLSLDIGNITISDFEVGLVIYSYNVYEEKPHVASILGLAFGLSEHPPTFLEQLRKHGVIGSLSYSVRTNGDVSTLTGNITLDDTSQMRVGTDVRLTRDPAEFKQLVVIPLWPVSFLNSKGALLRYRYVGYDTTTKKDGPSLGYVDTGSKGIHLPEGDFDNFRRVADKFIRFSRKLDVYIVGKENISHLPVLALTLGEAPHQIDIRIQPKHYVYRCSRRSCTVGVFCYSLGEPILGHPLFHAYDVGFYLSSDRPYTTIQESVNY
ncbi:hypothetical protein FOL47_009482 [Perkinsus chesapeaki]|uniref:Peptidase A1 domain-containing protein n=1 Tax=Perkinsus chesapeaki TaxID=330153 RepID=A0A7J6L833_PERCH|nr:hypothetical protein FOL47_009482 [Perkinsus chesapeaki]